MSNDTDAQKPTYIDYKDVKALREFINPHGRILGRKRTNLNAKEQRHMDEAIKRARFMGFLPYIEQ